MDKKTLMKRQADNIVCNYGLDILRSFACCCWIFDLISQPYWISFWHFSDSLLYYARLRGHASFIQWDDDLYYFHERRLGLREICLLLHSWFYSCKMPVKLYRIAWPILELGPSSSSALFFTLSTTFTLTHKWASIDSWMLNKRWVMDILSLM